MTTAIDLATKLFIYKSIADTGRTPRKQEIGATLAMNEEEVTASLGRLREQRLLYLAVESGEIVMAPPFSAVPTAFNVIANGTTYHANCVWDAYGIAAALHRDTDIQASCGCCGEPMRLAVRDGKPTPEPGVAHFAVPARHWWDDLTFT